MKRVLSFLLALIMVIGMIPIIANAAAPMPKVTMYDPSGTIDCRVGGSAEYKTWYIKYEDVVDDTGAVIGNKPVQTFTEPEDNYIRYYYDSTNCILYITLNNVHYTRTASAEHFIRVSNNSSYTKAFSVIITLNGENTVSGTRTTLLFENTGNVTFTGDGLLDIQTYLTSNAVIWAKGGGDLTIKDTNLTVYNSHGYIDATGGTVAGIMAAGSILVDGATINVDGGKKSTALRTATATGSGLTSPVYGITIKHNANVVCTSGSVITLQTNGPIVIDNSNVNLHKGTANYKPVFNKAPEIIGSYSSMKAGCGSLSKTYPGTYDVTPGVAVAESQRLTDFELVHKHVGTDCTKESLCACTKATVAATAESHTLESIEAQEATCTVDGWEAYEYCVNCAYSTKVVIPATGTHAIVQVDAKSATCGEIGWEAHEYCELCDYNTMVEIPATGEHTVIQVEAKAPTCGDPGWEAHEACSGCSTYSTKVEIPATGDHTYAYAEAKQATCAEPGWNAYRYCTECSYSEKEIIPASGILSQKPFYMLNGEVPENLRTYMYTKPSFYTKTFVAGQTVPTVSWNGASTIPTLAAKLKAEFDDRPAGMRYFKLDMVAKTMHGLVEHNVYFDKAETEVTKWLEAFLAEYYRIGGKLDGIQVDSEYIYSGAWYIHLARYEKNPSARYNDPDIFWNIVNDPRYETEIRPRLVEVGFPFLAESSQTSLKSEIWGIDTQNSKAYNLWNLVNYYRMVEMIDRAVYQPLIKYYPNALVTDYQVRYINGWQKAVMNTAGGYGSNRIGLGTTSNFNAYAARPQDSVYGGGSDAAYTTPAAYNGAAYEPNPFNMVLWEANIFKDMYDANPYNRVAAHMTFFNYNPNKKGTYSNTPYYTESFYHIALMDPEPFMGYIIESEVFSRGKDLDDPNIADFGYNLSVVEDILKELSRVAGASDRKHIPVSSTWNSSFILSGMYAGGRNIWRITPDTYTGVSLAEFKVKDQAPTFYINGQTVIFPQGRIIEDGKIKQVGSCGYWVETPADVKPIIINDTDRYSKYPSLQENFDGYTAGAAFTTDTALPKATWTVSGSATVQSHNGSNALGLTGTTTVNHLKLPANITAGDSYANNQVWEVKVTLPYSGKVNVLSTSSWDIGITITNGTVTYSEKYSKKTLSGVTLSAGGTYIIRRTLDLTGMNMKASFDIYDMTGKRIGGVSNVTVYRLSTGPITQISFGSSITSGTAYIDDFKMYPIGVTTEFEAYDAASGFKLDSATATRNEDTAYRLSWMNASSEYKIAKVMNNGVVVEQILMAPGADGVATGVITGTNIKLSVSTENGTAPTYPDYDKGDFDWTSPAELIGLASGKSKGSFDPNNLTSIVLHDLVFVEGKDSSCTEDGWDAYEYCSKCDYSTYKIKEAHGHKPGAAADCENDQVCTVCGEKLADKLGHKPGAAADCENDQVCTVCGEKLADKLGHKPGAAADCENDQVCTVCGEKLADKLGHKPGAAADCENDQVCTVCGEKLADKLGHKPGAEADCENDQVCTVCGEKLADKLGHKPGAEADCENDQVCTVCGEKLADKLGHKPGAAADCENDQVCTVCGEKLADKLGHKPGAAADCENDQVCTVCGEKLADKLGHKPGAAADCENDQVCTVCGEKLADKLGHKPGAAADCENDQVCTVCGEKLADKLGHKPGAAADCENDQVCTVCGEKLTDKLGHKPGAAADCENDQVCTVCGEKLADKLGHKPGAAADCENAQTCTVCGKELATSLGHKPGAAAGENDQVCTVCGEKLADKLGHKPGAAADCENAQTCTVCGKELATSLGHKPGAEADCENDQICTVCEKVLKPRTGHTYEKVVTPPTTSAQGYTTYTCACGDSYVSDYVSKLSTIAKNMNTGKLYTSITEAVNAANSGDVIRLTKKVNEGAAIEINKDITVDFGGYDYTVSIHENGAALVIHSGNVTLQNGKLQIRYAARNDFANLIVNNGTLTTRSITLNGNNLYAAGETATIANNGTLALNSGTVINVRVNGLVNTGSVTKTVDVVLTAPEGSCWKNDTVLSAHVYVTTKVPATVTEVSYDLHKCACGAFYKDNFGTTKLSGVAKIGNNFYGSLPEAVAAAQPGDLIVLVKNVNQGAAILVDKNVTIDLGGYAYTVELDNAGAAMVILSGNVILQNGKLQVRYSARADFANLIVNNGTLTTRNITLNGNNLYAAGQTATIVNNGTLALNAGTVINVRISGLVNTGSATKAADVVLPAPEGSCWKNDTVLSAHAYVTTKVPATVTEVSYDLHKCACGASYKDNFGTATLSVVAVIGEQKYTSLQAAVDAANAGDVIRLTKSVNQGSSVVINKNVTIDFGGFVYTVSKANNGAAIVITEGVEATLTNGTVQIRYSARADFSALIGNNGTLNVNNITLKGNNAYAAGATLIRGNAYVEGEGVSVVNP